MVKKYIFTHNNKDYKMSEKQIINYLEDNGYFEGCPDDYTWTDVFNELNLNYKEVVK